MGQEGDRTSLRQDRRQGRIGVRKVGKTGVRQNMRKLDRTGGS